MESDIRAAQEAALEAVETDSIMTGTSANPEDSSLFGTTRPLPYYVSSFVAMMVKTFQWKFLKHLSFAHLMLVFWQNNSKLDQDESLNFIVDLYSAIL